MKRMNKYDINNEQTDKKKLNKHVALHFYCYYFIKIFLQLGFWGQKIKKYKDKVKTLYKLCVKFFAQRQ